MGFSQDDLAELQARLNAGKVRLGPRIQKRAQMQITFMGQVLEPNLQKRAKKAKPGPDVLSYDAQYQLRLW